MPSPHLRASARRRFLLNAGAAALVATPFSRLALACSAGPKVRVGVMVPRAERQPELDRDFLNGFLAYAAQPQSSLEIVRLDCDAGPLATLKGADAHCPGVDILAVVASQHLSARLGRIVEKHGVPVLACDLGADFVRQGQGLPNVATHSLGLWQAHYAMGTWTRHNLGSRVVIATDFLESGYDMIYAFRRAFEAAGGDVAAVQVTALPDGTGTFADVAASIRSHRPDFVYALYSAERAHDFADALHSEGITPSIPLAGPGFLAASASRPGLFTVSPWYEGIVSAENERFLASVRAVAPGRAPSLFTLLGYESAQRIASAVTAAGPDAYDAVRVVQEMRRFEFAGPRGMVARATALAETPAPAYVKYLAGGVERLEALAPLALDEGQWRDLRTTIKSGWSQAYLSA